MTGWLAEHAELVTMTIGGAASFVGLLIRGARDTQRVLHRLDTVANRLERVEKSVEIGSESRARLHSRIDGLSGEVDAKVGDVRERIVVLETRAEVAR